MKKWSVVILLALAQFVMILDSTVMNVSISTIVKDLDTTVALMQTAITFYTLTMASFMLLGGKLGDTLGRKKSLLIGCVIYAFGALITGLSPNVGTLMFGWSLIEGFGAIMVIPAVAALIATNYKGKDRVTAYAIIGAVSGAAAAAGPLIGGFITTYLSWRYVFYGEVLIIAVILLFSNKIVDIKSKSTQKIDILSVLLSASGSMLLIFGMLQSKVWGWITPLEIPEINGLKIAPLGISVVVYLIVAGIILLKLFYNRQQRLEVAGKNPLLKVSMFSISQLRSGLTVLTAQYIVMAAIFFIIPIYLQMTLGYDALQTGVRILPLSVAVILASVIGARLSGKWSPRNIIRFGQILLIFGALALIGSISTDLRSIYFMIGMACVGGGLGLLASQIGNINMSAVSEKETAEVGGLQGVAQNIGSSLGTALIGSILVAALTTAFVGNIQSSNLPTNIKTYIQQNSTVGVSIMPVSEVSTYAHSKGLSDSEVTDITDSYTKSQIEALKQSLVVVVILATLTLLFSKGIPKKI